MAQVSSGKTTPMMSQWEQCKQAAKDAVLFFRMGDFYEAFYDDAATLARLLNLTLTKRQGIPMAGIPHHACEGYIDRLVASGIRVAVAEQLEDPKKTKGIVKRGITRVVTPGTVLTSSLLAEKSNNFFAALHHKGSTLGFSFIDLGTSEFRVVEFDDPKELLNELHRLRPSEILCSRNFKKRYEELLNELQHSYQYLLDVQEDWVFDLQSTESFLCQHFRVQGLDGFGLKEMPAGITAAGALLKYIQEQLCLPTEHVLKISTYDNSQHLLLDRATLRNLELTEALQDGTRRNTLLSVIDQTQTPMGGRLLQQWIKKPLLSVTAIEERQGAIQGFLEKEEVSADLRIEFAKVRDLERLMTRISSGYAGPRDLLSLRFSLEQLPQIRSLLEKVPSSLLENKLASLEDVSTLCSFLETTLEDEVPAKVTDGQVIRAGYHKELDELRTISRNSKEWLNRYQEGLREELGIKTLKVGYTRAFGYYIDVSKGQASRMPETFLRRQTLTNNERFLSPELKEFEQKVLSAQDRITALESQLYNWIRQETAKYAEPIMRIAEGLATIDCLLGLAKVAADYAYIRPQIHDGLELNIEEGRHPVVESANCAERFIPNDTIMDPEQNRLLLITGPNMAGKSTYIRQVALLVILAQIGSFIPARRASMGIVDKVFTRIGASDDLSRGQSTFMVEMTETANILHNVSPRSLVILDEIGRGTSTYDGISIAWSVAEYLLTTEGRTAKTLFATHYWELTKLETEVHGAANYHVAVRECEDEITFLRKIVRGDTDKSYGIHVGRLAGLPKPVLERARQILLDLESKAGSPQETNGPQANSKTVIASKLKGNEHEIQLLMFEPPNQKQKVHPLVRELKKLDLNKLSPIDAHQKLVELKTMFEC
ncbi:MAG: DNA mismatch repair protein MutS [Waddliaceae bacterium]|nr:DNA mismatch repair protein MutS [Waddliaceae bacterium]